MLKVTPHCYLVIMTQQVDIRPNDTMKWDLEKLQIEQTGGVFIKLCKLVTIMWIL